MNVDECTCVCVCARARENVGLLRDCGISCVYYIFVEFPVYIIYLLMFNPFSPRLQELLFL